MLKLVFQHKTEYINLNVSFRIVVWLQECVTMYMQLTSVIVQ